MTQREWLDRYARRIMEVANVGQVFGDTCAEAESFDVLSEGYEDDPEGAADSEMSYWTE